MRVTRLLVPTAILAGFSQPLAAQAAAQFEGRPASVEGVDLGYYLWHDEDGWQIRWTTKGVRRHFAGTVVAEGGELKSLKRIDAESERKVLYPGRPPRVWVGPRGRTRVAPGRAPVVVEREQDKIEKEDDHTIVWSSRTDFDIDGFRFRVDDTVTTLRFHLTIDGSPRPMQVEIGKENIKPGKLPLVVTLK
ncbi:MAG: hypothetical protein ACT4PM_13930 [Gemmatimonadales bacterium]